MPSAGFCRYGRFRAMRAAVRASGLRVGCSPLGASPGGSRRQEEGQFFLANQNLQDLVLKCLLRTKDSRVDGTWQALFDAQEGPPETTTKTAHCGSICRVFTLLPPAIHRLVHRIASRRTVGRALQFYDSAKGHSAKGPLAYAKVRRDPSMWGLPIGVSRLCAYQLDPARRPCAVSRMTAPRVLDSAAPLRRVAELDSAGQCATKIER